MNMNQKITMLEKFFESNAIKDIFDNIRNLMLSTVVLIAGNYLLVTIAPNSDSPWFPSAFGRMFIGCGFILLTLCVLNGYCLLKNSIIPVAIARIVSFIYGSLAIVFFTALLRSNGITL